MPLMDRLVGEALEGLCPDCPVRDWTKGNFNGDSSGFYDDDDLPVEIGPEHAGMVELGSQIAATMHLASVLMLKEEIGCDGVRMCEHDEATHCGALSLISFAVSLEVETATDSEE